MKYLIDKEKLFGYDLKNFYTFLLAFMNSLVPYEEKKEGCEHKWNGLNECINCGISWYVWKREKNKDNRCTKCNGVGEIEKEFILYGSKYNERMICQHCNFTGKEPRKEQDTRTHAWEMKTYTQDEVRKMLEDLKMRDNLAGNSKEVQEDRKHMNAKIDKKIAEL